MKKFEVNHFSIKASNQLTEEDRSIIEQVFRDAVMWGILISERSNKERSPGDMAYFNKDYILNPLLSPYFKVNSSVICGIFSSGISPIIINLPSCSIT